MHKPRKICCRLTPGRIIAGIVLAASAVNLIIVGTAFELSFSEAVPTITETWTAQPATMTLLIPTVTERRESTITLEPSNVPTHTPTDTPTLTPTHTPTPTSTETPTPIPTTCMPRYSWQVYTVQRGDTLYNLAIATGSSTSELMQANCLSDSLIIAGQRLYLPRLPRYPTPVPPTITTPPNSPAEFKPYSVSCDPPAYISFSAGVYDPEGIASVDVLLYTGSDEFITTIAMTWNGEAYSGFGYIPEGLTVYDVGYYKFSAVDSFKNTTVSQPYRDRSSNCIEVG